jgi:hypothetical protein
MKSGLRNICIKVKNAMEGAGVSLQKIQRFRKTQILCFDDEAIDITFMRGIVTTELALRQTVQWEMFLKEKIEGVDEKGTPLARVTVTVMELLQDEFEALNKKYWLLARECHLYMSACKSGPLLRGFLWLAGRLHFGL